MKNGQTVAAFEKAFAEYVGAKHAIALVNGTATLHTALVALGVKPGDRVAVPPLTMASTTIAVLHAGAVPVFVDVDPDTWLMRQNPEIWDLPKITVSLYGLHTHYYNDAFRLVVDDAAQTLRPHIGGKDGGVREAWGHFTSYSFQSSKILPLGEGGMLVTNDEELATRAREFSSLGYRMGDGPRIDKATLKSPNYARHHSLGWNYRMNDLTAQEGLWQLPWADEDIDKRLGCADFYEDAIQGCSWLTPQKVPEGWTHDYWTYAVATDTPERLLWLLDAMERHGGERPYPAWRLTYHEPAFASLVGPKYVEQDGHKMALKRVGLCPNAESLQPRLCQFQTNDLASAERNAKALRKCIEEAG